MLPIGEPPRPPVLTLVATVSLIWSGIKVMFVVLWAVFAMLLGIGSWLLGPVVGAIGTLASMGVIAWMALGSLLSILLFAAAWYTFLGDPQGRELHRLWAWLNIALDLFALVLTWGVSPTSWFGLVYACFVLYVMELPEVQSYFRRRSSPWPPEKPSGIADDAF
jgi:hypothetical protein